MSRGTLQAARTPPRVTLARRGSVGSVAGTDGAGLSGWCPSRLIAGHKFFMLDLIQLPQKLLM